MPEAVLLGGGKESLDGAVFQTRFNRALVHETVRAELNARRRGTASTKTRSEVSGGSAKPWRQKGTGRARQGSTRAPHWSGGGVVFGPEPRSYTFKINRKARRAALRSALSMHADRGSLALLDPSGYSEPSTKQAARELAQWGSPSPTLIVLSEEDSVVAKSFRNLPQVAVLLHSSVGVADLLAASSVVFSRTALDAVVARAEGNSPSDDQGGA